MDKIFSGAVPPRGDIEKMRHAAAALLLLFAQGCNSPLEPPRREVRLRVAEISAPEVGSAEGELTITLTVETGGCTEFERIRATREGGTLTLEALGSEPTSTDLMCPGLLLSTPHSYVARGPFTNPLTINVLQPSGESTRRTVRIE